MLQNFDIGQFFDPRGVNFIIVFIALAVIVMMYQKSLTPGVFLIPLAFIISFSFNVYYRFAFRDYQEKYPQYGGIIKKITVKYSFIGKGLIFGENLGTLISSLI
jgi:hypothetical protein